MKLWQHKMRKNLLLFSIFIIFGVITFLSGYLFLPDQIGQTGLLVERFNNSSIDIKNTVPNISTVSSRKILSFTGPSLAKTMRAVDKDGDVIEINTDSLKETVISNLGSSNMSNVLLSNNGSAAIYSYYNSKNEKKYFYANLKADELIEIKDNIKSAAFPPEGDELAYILTRGDGGENELVLTKETIILKKLLKTRLEVATIIWPAEFLSILTNDKDGYGSLFVLEKDGSLNKLISDQSNLSVKWSPSGKKLVYSTKDENNIDKLFYKNIETNKNKDLTTAKATNCIWLDDEINVICGFLNLSLGKYEFYKINIDDGSKTAVATSDVSLIPKEMSISKSGDYLFILNEIDNLLYSLKLKVN